MSEGQTTATTSSGTPGNASGAAGSHPAARPTGVVPGASQNPAQGSARGVQDAQKSASQAKAPASGAAAPVAPGKQSAEAAIQRAKEAQAEAQEQMRKIKLKVYGQERELPESEVIKMAQQAESANRKFMKAAELEAKNRQLMQRLSNPDTLRESLLKLGYSEDQIDSIAEQTLATKLQRKMLEQTNPDKIRAMELEEKLKHYERQEREAVETQKQKEYAELVAQERMNFDRDISDAMSTLKIPKTEYTVDRFVKHLRQAIKLGYKNVSAKDVAPLVADDYRREYSSFSSNMNSVDDLIEYFGKDVVDKIRKWDVEKLKNPNSPQKFAVTPSGKPSEPMDGQPDSKKMSKAEWKNFIAKKLV